jgi:hypothetical protein
LHFFPDTLAYFKGNFSANNNFGEKKYLVSLTHKLNKTNDFSKPNYNIPIQYLGKLKIGLIGPTFTDADYNNKFYSFYVKYDYSYSKSNITKDLNLLNSKVSNRQRGTQHNVFAMIYLIKYIKLISNQAQVKLLTDTDINNGKIFDNHQSNLFNILFLGHQEYVTQKECDNLKKFVPNGGKMIAIDANIFYAQVKFFDNNNTISLVKGHGLAYSGKTVWKSINERWKSETQNWIGSNYLCYHCMKTFKNNPFDQLPHETNILQIQKIQFYSIIILLNYQMRQNQTLLYLHMN